MTSLIAMPTIASPLSGPGGGMAGPVVDLPELPVLSTMLHGATRLPVAADWRSGVLAALVTPQSVSTVPAVVAAQALAALPSAASVCLAMPVHAVAGISRMFLAPANSFVLDAAERETLRLAFNAEFGAPDLQLHAVGAGWLLQAPFAAAANDESPELLLGAALAREPARTAESRALRRLGAEVEMWLAGLPLNREREQRGAQPINCFWCWGGAVAGALQVPGPVPGGLFSNVEADAWLAGLASYCARPLQRALSWEEVRGTTDALVILQPPLLGDVVRQLPLWEEAWLEPARRDLAARRLPALRLQIGNSAWQLPAPRLTRWFRRRQPWWQKVSA
jgi:hypothetical protein